MKNTYSIPVTAFKIDDLSGSDFAGVAVIHVAWLNRVHCRRPAPALHPMDLLRGDGHGWLRGLLRPRSARPVDGVSTSRIGRWQSKASFPAIWPSLIRNSTPSPASSVMLCMTFLLAHDGPDRGRIARSHGAEALHLPSRV